MASQATQAISSGDLVDLVSSSGTATIYPNDDAILNVLQARFRADLPYTRIGATHLVVVNPYKTLANVNDLSAREYEDREYRDTSLPMADSPRPLQPHLYGLAARVYLMMRRRNESQALVTRGITGSGKSSSERLFVNQLLRLSTHSRKEARIAEQIKAFSTLLDSFGNAKTLMNPNATRHSRYTELHFNGRGRISSAKVLTFGLDKSRLSRLAQEERSFHIFYQLLAGATTHERDMYALEDMSDYALLASSGCYRLPSGPFSDDLVAMEDLRISMKTLGFKPKHLQSIFGLLATILLLGNLEFSEGDFHDVSAAVSNLPVLDQCARRLGVSSEDLAQVLTNRTSYVRKELYTVLLSAEQSAAQRDRFVKDLYAILFAFVVETANHKLASNAKDQAPATQIVIVDQAGFQTRGSSGTSSMALYGTSPLVSVYGQNGFDELCVNFADELVHSYVLRNTFEDNVGYNGQMIGDGVSLPSITIMDNSQCVELLRGAQLDERATRKPGGMLAVFNKAVSAFKAGKDGEKRDEDMVQELTSRFGRHASFVASPSGPTSTSKTQFGINHYSGPCTYEATHFIEKDADLLDSAFVSLLRNSSELFVAKLLSGPSLAAEKHSMDENTIVQAQVSSRPLRQATPVAAPDGSQSPAEHPQLDPRKVYPVTTQLNFTISEIVAQLERSRLWTLSCIRPNDSGSSNSFDKRRVKAQIRSLLLPDVASRRSVEFVAEYEKSQFCERYVPTMRGSDDERITQCARANGWKEGVDFVIGHRMVWMTYGSWKMAEDGLRAVEKEMKKGMDDEDESIMPDDNTDYQGDGYSNYHNESADNLLLTRQGTNGTGYAAPNVPYGQGGLHTPSQQNFADDQETGPWSEWDRKVSRPPSPASMSKEADGMVVKEAPSAVEEIPSSRSRRFWVALTWTLTFWIPDFVLRLVGRMKRPDVRLAWREKVTICFLILLLNGIVVFDIVLFEKLLCPDFAKAWNSDEVAEHTGNNDWWASVQGRVYDLSNFVHADHSSLTTNIPSNSADTLDQLAGQDLTYYFQPPLVLGCQDLVTDGSLFITPQNFTPTVQQAEHVSGTLASYTSSDLINADWYSSTFVPKMNQFYKGPLVWEWSNIQAQAAQQDTPRIWAVYENSLYDLTDYFNTITINPATSSYQFLNTNITEMFQERSGQDITSALNAVLDTMDKLTVEQNLFCLDNVFKVGETDFRKTARCQAQNIFLIVASGILMGSMGLKFLAALQLGSKRHPELQDKFVLCQVPCYTEGEDSLRRTIDSLAALNYDDKRKLIFIICDGNIIGSGNDRTTPRICLDILGVDPKLDPEPLLFKSVGEGAKALNYGKVYSGLYEFEGHVVPYMVIVKVGKPTERSKPGNRGKRDSQILLMHYLNRVHFDSPMSPLELEIYHQMRNVIGIDPAFYEYIFTIDADTSVTPESLNRLVAASADDSRIIGICGETKLDNEQGSWWTMIQVYEYYISHHLSKAFESLFGSVTCLPGCFSLYRIRTADKGRPIIISSRIIDEYSEPNVDTLHKKNLFSLGEDRFLTTLLMKHFPTFKTKFCPDAVARTVAPESFRILLSQRRRWINSTVHNLCELALLPELFGFCCFSMRFFVFVDLLSTLILPATVVYIFYLIITVALDLQPLPLIALIMICIVYGLQAIIFILKREFMLIGWMVVYILSYPVYSFLLPVYSFWSMDEFGWGNTRLVIGEGKEKKVVVSDDDKFDESMIPLKKFSEYEAEAWETASKRSEDTGYGTKTNNNSNTHLSKPLGSGQNSPRSYNQASQSGDYYRDTNLTYNNVSNPNLRLGGSQLSQSNLSQHEHIQAPQQQQQQQMPYQLPYMPFGGGPGSVAGSDHGGPMMHPIPFQNTGSMYGMMPPMMPGMGMFNTPTGGSFGGSQGGFAPPMMPAAMTGDQRPISTFSMATTVNLGGPSMNPNPSDDDLFTALRNYLSTQDLMTVTKKTAREAIATKFPKADLSSRKEFLNQSIDKILSS